MAHRGKFYPVHFRRDFNANCDVSSTTTLANKYRMVLQGLGVDFAYLNGELFDCLPRTMPDLSTLEWKSDPRTIHGHDWVARITVAFSALPDTLLVARYELFRDGVLAARWKNFPPDRFNPLDHGNLLTQDMLYINFAIFPNGCALYSSGSTAIGY